MLTCMAGLLIAGIAFIARDRHSTKRDMLQELAVLTRIIADRSTAAISFDDRRQAKENLAALAVKPSIKTACIIRPTDSDYFACYSRDSDQCETNWPATMPTGLTPEQLFQGSDLLFSQPIILDGQLLGTVRIRFDLAEITTRMHQQMYTALVIIGLAGLCALLVSGRLQRIISVPLSRLAETADRIARENDYSIRAELAPSDDEIGHLVEAFNSMLTRIEQRDRDLRQSEKRFRTLLDQAGDAFFLLDTDGAIVDVNQRACENLGYSSTELLNMNWAAIDAETGNQHREHFTSSLQHGQPITFECTIRRRDQSVFPVEVRLGRLEMGDKPYLLGLARDITTRKLVEEEKEKLESRLRQAQKMEAIGTLAGGIAHDFNNILTGIIGFTELVLSGASKGEEAKDDLRQVLGAGHRAKDLVRQILTFSRKHEQQLGPVSIQQLLKETTKMLRATIPTTIEIRQHIDMQTGSIISDQTQIHQLLLNLCTNAAHAMEKKGGVLEISLQEICLHGHSLHGDPTTPPQRYARLTVADTGAGMDQATMERMYEPYFTTKEVGKGSGMGLAMVHGIVKNLGGLIHVDSQPGVGTTFQVYLPIHEQQVPTLEVKIEPPPPGRGRILLVDDEQPIIIFVKRWLDNLGYQVTGLTDSVEALQRFKQAPEAFDLVISDQTMPHLPGVELAKELLRIKKELPIILCTGYSSTLSNEMATAIGVRALLMKPLDCNELTNVVQQALNKA